MELNGESVQLAGCPMRAIPPHTWEIITAWLDLERWGTWPVDGGTEAQAAGFLDAARILSAEKASYDG